ncbi:MAG TPA: hypothetical protein VGL08_15415 [Paraburkholderia sp.]|jgi:hypothetical protein
MFRFSTTQAFSLHTGEVHVDLQAGPATEHPAGTEPAKAGNSPLRTNVSSLPVPTPNTVAPASIASGSTSTVWPERYALKTKPLRYATTDTPGVLFDLDKKQKFIVHDEHAYAVAYDTGNATYRMVNPDDQSRPGFPVRVDSQRKWEMHSDAGLRGGGRTSGEGAGTQTPAQRDRPERGTGLTPEAQRLTDHLLRYPQSSPQSVATDFQVSERIVSMIVADIQLARERWHELQLWDTGNQASLSAIEAPLTDREKQYVQKWHDELSASNFAELMKKPRSVIDAYLQGDEYRDAVRPGLSEPQLSTSADGATRGSTTKRGPGKVLPQSTQDRIVLMLTSNPTMSYLQIGTECKVSEQAVKRQARIHGKERTANNVDAGVRSELMDDFVLFPGTSMAELADQHRLPKRSVLRIRRTFERARSDWGATHKADVQAGRPELQMSLTDPMKAFIREWGKKFPAGNLSTIMGGYESAIDAYMHSDAYRESVLPPAAPTPVSQPAASSQAEMSSQRMDSPQPGSSGTQTLLTEEQKAEIRRWGGGGMLPDSLSMYLGKPQSTIEAYLQTAEYRDYARSMPPLSPYSPLSPHSPPSTP